MAVRYDNAAAAQLISTIDSTLSLAEGSSGSQNVDVVYGVEEDIYYTYANSTWTKHENDADNNFCCYKVYTIKGFLAACQVANANVYLMNDLEVYKDKNYRNGILDSSGSPSGKNLIIKARKITSYAARDNFEDIENISEGNICSIYGLKANQCSYFFNVNSNNDNDKFDKVYNCGTNIYNINFLSSLLSYDGSNVVTFTNSSDYTRVRFKNCDISIVFKGRRNSTEILKAFDRYDFCSIFAKYVSLSTVIGGGSNSCTCLRSEINNSYIHLEGDVVASNADIVIAEDMHNSTLDLRNITLWKKISSFGSTITINCKVLNSSSQNVIINIADPIMDMSDSTPMGSFTEGTSDVTLKFTSSGGGVNLIHSDNADFILPDLEDITFTTNMQIVSSNNFKSYPTVDYLRNPDVLLDSNFLPN